MTCEVSRASKDAWPWMLIALLPCWGTGCASTSSTSGNKFLGMFAKSKSTTPSAIERNDPTSPFSKQKKPCADLFVTMAQFREQAGDLTEAEALYEKARKAEPKSLAAAIGYAHLEDRRGNLESAAKLYKEAISRHPKEAGVHNDLGLCYHRRGMLKESAESLRRAVELQPDRQLYRNNLATVLVDLDRDEEAPRICWPRAARPPRITTWLVCCIAGGTKQVPSIISSKLS